MPIFPLKRCTVICIRWHESGSDDAFAAAIASFARRCSSLFDFFSFNFHTSAPLCWCSQSAALTFIGHKWIRKLSVWINYVHFERMKNFSSSIELNQFIQRAPIVNHYRTNMKGMKKTSIHKRTQREREYWEKEQDGCGVCARFMREFRINYCFWSIIKSE